MTSIVEQKKYINEIGLKIGEMSFIIGAGFSKNISQKYMSWWELMQDMVKEMYTKDISFHNMSTDDIIKKIGYLGIASDYVRRKGYHEAVDYYIESRTPVLVKNGHGGFDLVLNGKTEETDVDRSLHSSLLSLYPKNIFTFNYDNAFECEDEKVYDPDKEADPKLQAELKFLQQILRSEYKKKYANLYNAYIQHVKGLSASEQADNIQDLDEVKPSWQQYEVALNDFQVSIINKARRYVQLPDLDKTVDPRKQCQSIRKLIQTKVNELSDKIADYRNNKDTYLLVTKSTDITINAFKHYIYKLHGTLRNYDSGSHQFKGGIEFDNDHHTQYIITTEDYNTYDHKHEAFVDLMRINLLKESFCIIGFSCDDPNFLLWINWVKDINVLAKEHQAETGKKYYINVDSKRLPADKSLLLYNHGITIINLFEIYKDKDNPKELLKSFFEDLQLCQNSHKLYQRMWEESNLWVSSGKPGKGIKYNPKLIHKAWKDTVSKPLCFMDDAFDHNRLEILRDFEGVIKKKLLNEDVAKLYYMATNRSNLPFSSSLSSDEKLNEEISQNFNDKELKSKIREDEVLQRLLEDGTLDKEGLEGECPVIFELLNRWINFDYSDIDIFLKKWEPKDKISYVYKQHLLTPGTDILSKVSEWTIFKGYRDRQEYLFALQMLGIYGWESDFNDMEDKVFSTISDKIKNLVEEYPELINFRDYINKVCARLRPKEEVIALGESKVFIKFDYYDEPYVAAMKAVNFIAKLGSPSSSFITKENWLFIARKLYWRYPAAILYYSTLYSDSSLSKSVGQMYAYDTVNISDDFLRKYLFKMLHACISYSKYVETESLLIISRYFIKRIDSKYWSGLFKKLFDAAYKSSLVIPSGKDYWQINRGLTEFIISALELLKDKRYKNSIALRILKKGEYITNFDNRILLACKIGNNFTKGIKKAVLELVSLTPTMPIAMVLFNYRQCIPFRKFSKWMSSLPMGYLASNTLLPTIAKLAKQKRSLRKDVFYYIDHCTDLWYTGVTLSKDEEKVAGISDSNCLYIQSVEEYINLPEQQILNAYKKAERSIFEIKTAVKSNWLMEMTEWWSTMVVSIKSFLTKHKKVLCKEQKYQIILNQCSVLYQKICGFSTVIEKLLSDNGSRVREAVFELQILIKDEGFKKHNKEISTLLLILIEHKGPVIGSCLQLVRWLITNYPTEMQSNEIRKDIVLILQRYYPYFNGDEIQDWAIQAEKDYVESILICINKFLKGNGVEVKEWTKYTPVFQWNKIKSKSDSKSSHSYF